MCHGGTATLTSSLRQQAVLKFEFLFRALKVKVMKGSGSANDNIQVGAKLSHELTSQCWEVAGLGFSKSNPVFGSVGVDHEADLAASVS